MIVAAVLSAAGAGAAERVQGAATVADGQTLSVQGQPMRLTGILAPPLDLICRTKRGKPYDCGNLARQALAEIVKGGAVSCVIDKPGDPPAATCVIGPFAVNEQLLLTGRVLAAPGAGRRYQRAQQAARVLNEGLWKGKFPPPESWRPGLGD